MQLKLNVISDNRYKYILRHLQGEEVMDQNVPPYFQEKVYFVREGQVGLMKVGLADIYGYNKYSKTIKKYIIS